MFHSRATLVAFAVTCALASAAQAEASVLHVCPTCTLNTIQQGIDAASSGDTVRIDPGIYAENISVNNKTLTLVGTGGAAATEIRGTGTDSTVTLGTNVTSVAPIPVTIDGLTISNGNATDSNTHFSGGGINVQASALLHLKNSVVQNSAAPAGGGIGLIGGNSRATSQSTVESSTIVNNQAHEGGGIYVGINASLAVVGTTVTGNATGPTEGTAPGGGIYAEPQSQVSLDSVAVTRNTGLWGAGVYFEIGSTATVTRTTITENSTLAACAQAAANCPLIRGIGLFSSATLKISDSTISHNTGRSLKGILGGGICILPFGDTSIDQTVVGFNDTLAGAGTDTNFVGQGGGIFIIGDSNDPDPEVPISLSDVYIINNHATDALGLVNNGTRQLKTNGVTIKDNLGAP
jgi:hypothetical protein